MDETSSVDSAAETPETLPPVMASNGDAGPTIPMVDAPIHASTVVTQFGGLRGGRERLDGLIPGSVEAKEADKLYDRVRKWRKNHPDKPHAEESKLPPVMAQRILGDESRINAAHARERIQPRPAYLRQPARPGIPPALPMAPMAETDGGENSDIRALADATAAAVETWQGTDIEPVLSELLNCLKELLEMRRERQMIAAQFPPEIAKEILQSAKWSPTAEKMLCQYGSRILAKLANQANLPVTYKDEIFAGSAVVMILAGEIRLERRMLKIMVDLKKNPPKT